MEINDMKDIEENDILQLKKSGKIWKIRKIRGHKIAIESHDITIKPKQYKEQHFNVIKQHYRVIYRRMGKEKQSKVKIPVDEEEGTIIFDVRYTGILGGLKRKHQPSCRIELKVTQTLIDLHNAVNQYWFNWEDDHLYSFNMDDIAYSINIDLHYYSPSIKDCKGNEDKNTADIKIKDLGLVENQEFLYIFDYGDDHRYKIKVVSYNIVKEDMIYPCVIKKKGDVPRQYPFLEEEENDGK